MTMNNKTKNVSKKEDTKKIKELEQTVSNLTAMVQLLMNNNQANVNNINNADRDITFISLCNHILNLSTGPDGKGTVYTFNEFGEEQSIPYFEAKQIIKNNKKFIKGGKCFIADGELINSEHLENDYKKILNKDEILELMSMDRNKFQEIFNNMVDSQKEIFRDIISSKLSKDKNSVDMNIVQYVNEYFNINLLDSIKYGEFLLENSEK